MKEFELIEKEGLPAPVAKDILNEIDEKNYEQKMAYEHAKSLSKIDSKDAKEMVKELKDLDMRKLKEKFIVKIADIVPEDEDQLRAILSPSKVSFKQKEIDEILEIVGNYE